MGGVPRMRWVVEQKEAGMKGPVSPCKALYALGSSCSETWEAVENDNRLELRAGEMITFELEKFPLASVENVLEGTAYECQVWQGSYWK